MALDLVDTVHSYKKYQERFALRPASWRAFSTSRRLTWSKVRFNVGNKAAIPKVRGVYAFVVGGEHDSLPPHGYVMYIGETGHGNNRTLRVRFGEYLKEQQTEKRPGVHYMLKCWRTCLYFCYAEITDRRLNLKKLEKALNDAMFPPFSTNDFTATIRRARKAF